MKILSQIFLLYVVCPLCTIFFSEAGNECKVLKEGLFVYGSGSNIVRVVISGDSHTEYHNGGKYIIKSKLNWVNDCEYNATLLEVTIPDFPYGRGDLMNVKVERVVDKEIYFVSTVNNKSWSGKLIKIK